MADAKSLSPKEIISGLAGGNPQACECILRLATRLSLGEADHKILTRDDLSDLINGALVDVLSAVHSGRCSRGSQLLPIVKRSISRNARRIHDHYELRAATSELDNADNNLEFQEDWRDLQEDSAPPKPTKLYRENKSATRAALTCADLLVVDDEMIKFLARHPQRMYQLSPRRFEELVAAILKNLGYTVELTAEGADGGVDIFAAQKSSVGEILLVVDCKRYSQHRHVGVDIVRALYGIGEQRRATMAMLATTSFFTRPAQEFQHDVRNRLSLRDYDHLVSWLREYGNPVRRASHFVAESICPPNSQERSSQPRALVRE